MNLFFDLLNDRIPHGGNKGFFGYGDAQVDEVSQIMIDMNVKNLGYISKSNHIAVPAIKLTLIQVCCTSIGTKKKVEGLKKISSDLRGGTAQEDSVISEKSMINWLDSGFKGEAWEESSFLKSIKLSTQGIND